LADNAIHGAWVAGEPSTDWRGIDFPTHPVSLAINDQRTLTGSGAAVLGNPLTVVAWLATELPRFGRRLRRGDRVTTGITTDIYLAEPGDRLVADFGPLGRAALEFELA
jgi:2-keto-4-pentenoate hydratase